MKRCFALGALVALAAPAAAQGGPAFSLEQRMLLRCSAAFAIVSGEQQRGVAASLAYPALGQRGQEYFVHAGARLMDELQLSPAQLEASMRAEVAALEAGARQGGNRAAYLDGVMRPCLSALDASGL